MSSTPPYAGDATRRTGIAEHDGPPQAGRNDPAGPPERRGRREHPGEGRLAVWARRLAEGRYVVDSMVIADALLREAVEHARSLPPVGFRSVGPSLH